MTDQLIQKTRDYVARCDHCPIEGKCKGERVPRLCQLVLQRPEYVQVLPENQDFPPPYTIGETSGQQWPTVEPKRPCGC